MVIQRDELIAAARQVLGEFALRKDFSAASVGAAILTASGSVYAGVCIDLTCGLGFCAEVAAAADMLKHRETHVVAVVAVSEEGIIPPCGRCRETLAQIDARNLDCRVILSLSARGQIRRVLVGDRNTAKYRRVS